MHAKSTSVCFRNLTCIISEQSGPNRMTRGYAALDLLPSNVLGPFSSIIFIFYFRRQSFATRRSVTRKSLNSIYGQEQSGRGRILVSGRYRKRLPGFPGGAAVSLVQIGLGRRKPGQFRSGTLNIERRTLNIGHRRLWAAVAA